MKNLIIAAVAVSAIGLAAAPASAQVIGTPSAYVNLGYSHIDPSGLGGMGTVTGRLGARFGSYFGVEGEGGFGVFSDKGTTAGGVAYRNWVKHQVAGYAVGYLPITPAFDLFVRGGYGNTLVGSSVGPLNTSLSRDSWNYGVGTQYFFTGGTGLRVDYTRNDYRNGAGHADVLGASFVQKF